MRKSRELNCTSAVILIVLTLLFSASDLQAQPKLNKGINLGRFLNGQIRWTTFWPHEQQIKVIKGRGFDHIRILVNPGDMFDLTKGWTNQPDPRLQELVKNCVAAEIPVILSLDLFEDRFQNQTFDDPFVTKLKDFWNHFAAYFSALSIANPDLIFFETLNEPQLEDGNWYLVQKQLALAIHSGASKNTILLTGAQGSSLPGLIAEQPVTDVDAHFIYSFHFYLPYPFTQQQQWGKYKEVQAAPYPFSRDAAIQSVQKMTNASDRAFSLYDLGTGYSEAIQADTQLALDWAKAHNVTILCDEFGVSTQAGDTEAAAWIRDVRAALESRKIGWTYWDYTSQSFGLARKLNTDGTPAFDQAIVDAVLEQLPGH
jgi:aryl-phospho-beta-D-glucosidase BglC (GH1 family)